MQIKREVPKNNKPLSRIQSWTEYQRPFSEIKLKEQSSRCLDCGTPFCHTGMEIAGKTYGCPLYNYIPEWNQFVHQGKWKAALESLLATNNFPEFTGRACPAPCEGSCTVALYDKAVAIKSIEQAIIDRGFDEGWISPKPPTQRTGKQVAIVGSGPAGLASADQLNKAGHTVTVYERSDRIGGLLMYGIPNMKLEKKLVERRVKLLAEEGVRFITNVEIGKDIEFAQLQAEFDAVILCTGASQPRALGINGQASTGVHFAMDYLTTTTKQLLDPETNSLEISATGKDVIVIGGGDTGADCIATALRQKCRSIVQFGRHPQLPTKRATDNPWPEQPEVFTLDYAYEEATAKFGHDPRQYSIITKQIVSDEQGTVKELHTIKAKKVTGEQAEVLFKEIPGSEQVWPAQLVLVATGFAGAEETFLNQVGLAHKNLKVTSEYGKYTTNLEGVFAAGDMRRGQSLIVWAIHEGREAAREVDKYLMGSSNLP